MLCCGLYTHNHKQAEIPLIICSFAVVLSRIISGFIAVCYRKEVCLSIQSELPFIFRPELNIVFSRAAPTNKSRGKMKRAIPVEIKGQDIKPHRSIFQIKKIYLAFSSSLSFHIDKSLAISPVRRQRKSYLWACK